MKWLKNWEQQYTNPETVGLALSETVSQGDWRLLFLLRDRVRALTRDEVQRVAQARFVPANRTTATYVPTDRPQRAPAPERVDVAQQMNAFKPQAAAAAVPAFDTTPSRLDAKTRRFALSNGMKVALLPKPTRGQTVKVAMQFRVGDERSLLGQREVSEFAAAMLDKGTTQLSRLQIQDRLDALQAELSIGSSGDQVDVSLLARRDTVVGAIALLAQRAARTGVPRVGAR